MAVVLVLLGAWMVFAAKTRPLAVMEAVSDVIWFESQVKTWAEKRKEEGKLEEGDLKEIFTERGGLKVGRDGSEVVLRDMVASKVGRGMSSVWPGVAVVSVGLLGFLPGRVKKRAR